MLRVVVLGIAAGGGVPQWNCSFFKVLNEQNVEREAIVIDQPLEPGIAGRLGVWHRNLPFAVSGKGAWYLEGKAHAAGNNEKGDMLGLRISNSATAFAASCK